MLMPQWDFLNFRAQDAVLATHDVYRQLAPTRAALPYV
jgi:hypothetical protein